MTTHTQEQDLVYGGMNQDDDIRFVEPGDYISAQNFVNGIGGAGGVGSNYRSTLKLDLDFLPVGTNTCIGAIEDKSARTVIAFFHNTMFNHSIVRYQYKENGSEIGNVKMVANGNYLDFHKENLIHSAAIINGSLLYWTDAKGDMKTIEGNSPRKLNIDKSNRFGKFPTYELDYDPSAFYLGQVLTWSIEDLYGNELNQVTAILSGPVDIDTVYNTIVQSMSLYDIEVSYCGDCSIKFESLVQDRVIKFVDQPKMHWYGVNVYDTISSENLNLIKRQPKYAPTATYRKNSDLAINNLEGELYQFRVRYVYDDGEKSAYGPVSQIKVPYGDITSSSRFSLMLDREYNEILVDYTDPYLLTASNKSFLKAVEVAYREGATERWKYYDTVDRCDFGVLRNQIVFDLQKLGREVSSDANIGDDAQSIKAYDFVPQKSLALEVVSDENGNATLLLGGNLENYDLVDCVDVEHEQFVFQLDDKTVLPNSSFQTEFPGGTFIRSMKPDQLFLKDDGVYEFGIVYRDNFGRRSGVHKIGRVKINSDRVMTNSGTFTTDGYVSLVGFRIGHDAPAWAETYSIVRTKNLEQDEYLKIHVNTNDIDYLSSDYWKIRVDGAVAKFSSALFGPSQDFIISFDVLDEDIPDWNKNYDRKKLNIDDAGTYNLKINIVASMPGFEAFESETEPFQPEEDEDDYLLFKVRLDADDSDVLDIKVYSELRYIDGYRKQVFEFDETITVPDDCYIFWGVDQEDTIEDLVGEGVGQVSDMRLMVVEGYAELTKPSSKENSDLLCINIDIDNIKKLDPSFKLFDESDDFDWLPQIGDYVRLVGRDVTNSDIGFNHLTSFEDNLVSYIRGCKTIPSENGEESTTCILIDNAEYLPEIPESGITWYIEFYRKLKSDDLIYYDTGNIYDVFSSGGRKLHKGNIRNQNAGGEALVLFFGGDTLLYNRSEIEFPLWSTIIRERNFLPMNRSRVLDDLGVANIFDKDLGQTYFYNQIRASNLYVTNSKINGLSSYRPLDIQSIDPMNGSVQKLALAGQVLLCIGEFKTQPIYISRDRLMDLRGDGLVGRTNRLLNIGNETMFDFGTVNGESVVVQDGWAYGWDSYHGIVWRYTSSGQRDISRIKMHNTFKKLGAISYESNSACIGGFDRVHGAYLISIEGKAYLFDGEQNRWKSELTQVPDYYVSAGPQLIGVKGGKLWLHHQGQGYNNFYGADVETKIRVPINDTPGAIKVWQNVRVQSNNPVFIEDIEVLINEGQPNMKSRIPLEFFEINRGQYWADFLRNEEDEDFANEDASIRIAKALNEGELLRGDSLAMTIVFANGEKYCTLRSISCNYTVDMRTNI